MLGTIVGAFIAYEYAKNKCFLPTDIIESLNSYSIDTEKTFTASDKQKYNEIVKEQYQSDRPYVITPDEFGELDGYNTVSLTYFKDGIIADDCNEIIDNAEDIIGIDPLTHFGEYEDDSVFVRNDMNKNDYEILRDQRNYSDVIKTIPHYMEE